MGNNIKSILLLCLTLCISTLTSTTLSFSIRAQEVTPIIWGGGGAFTGVSSYKEHLYLSSDVSGVWKQTNASWEPYLDGLSQYNVSALVTFNNLLFAITTDELLYTDGQGSWLSTNIKLDTRRSSTDKPYAVSDKQGLMCIASLNNKIQCVDQDLNEISIPLEEKIITGVMFPEGKGNNLYFYSNNKVLTLNVANRETTLLAEFENKVIGLIEYENSILVATSKNIYDLQHPDQAIYSASSKNIINIFTTNTSNKNNIFIGLGSNKWNVKLHQLVFENKTYLDSIKVDVNLDISLPHRIEQTALTKFLSVQQIDNDVYLTDYWGVFTLSKQAKPKLLEITNNAYNLVATDLVLADKYLYISTMDNGVIKIDKTATESNILTPKAISFDSIKGHAWSMMYRNKTLSTMFSPWDKANDYIFNYSEVDNAKTTSQLTHYDSRPDKGAFWGESYSRQLAYFHGFLSFRDGAKGGLVTNKPNTLNIKKPYSLGELNRVYRAIAELNGLLYIGNCENPATIVALNQAAEEEFSIRTPAGFCAFTAYKHGNSLYFLGTNSGRSIIYKLVGKALVKYADMKVGSAFYAMAINPLNDQQIVIATISWSTRSTSGLFVSNNGGVDFVDKSCLLTHKNGVAAIDFDIKVARAYILQKVGGLITMPIATLFSGNTCSKAGK